MSCSLHSFPPSLAKKTTASSSNDLVVGFKRKSVSAFESFYDLYAPAFYGEIKKCLHNEDIAQQTLQNSFKTIWSSAEQMDPAKESLFIWAFRIVKKEISTQKVNILLKQIFSC